MRHLDPTACLRAVIQEIGPIRIFFNAKEGVVERDILPSGMCVKPHMPGGIAVPVEHRVALGPLDPSAAQEVLEALEALDHPLIEQRVAEYRATRALRLRAAAGQWPWTDIVFRRLTPREREEHRTLRACMSDTSMRRKIARRSVAETARIRTSRNGLIRYWVLWVTHQDELGVQKKLSFEVTVLGVQLVSQFKPEPGLGPAVRFGRTLRSLRIRRYGPYTAILSQVRSVLLYRGGEGAPRGGKKYITSFPGFPTRAELAKAIREHRGKRLLPPHFGFKIMLVDRGQLYSPYIRTRWDGPDLVATEWSDIQAIRGVQGIHAYLAPRGWYKRDLTGHHMTGQYQVGALVERYGRFVLGEDGWRAEAVTILGIVCEEGQAGEIRDAYPDIPVRIWE